LRISKISTSNRRVVDHAPFSNRENLSGLQRWPSLRKSCAATRA
jgi:hypothetical protein